MRITLVLVFVVITAALAAAGDALTNRIVVRVGDHPVTEFDLTLYLRYNDPTYFHLSELIGDSEKLDAYREARELRALQDLVRGAAILRYAETELGIKVTKETRKELRRNFRDEKTEKYGSWEKFLEYLAGIGVTEEQAFAFELKREMITQVRLREYRRMPDPTPAEVRQYYEANPELFLTPMRYRVRHFTVLKSVGNRSDAEARAAADAALAAVNAGASFADVARNSSDAPDAAQGGVLEWNAGNCSLLSPLPDIVEKLDVGQMSGVVETADGYHFVRLERVEPPHKLSIETIWDRIENALKGRNWSRAKALVLSKALEKTTFRPESLTIGPSVVSWKEFLEGNLMMKEPPR